MCRLVPLLALLLLLAGCDDAPTRETGTTTDTLGNALGGEPDPGFARATGERTFRFPYDHGPHPAYRNEWWYITGNLDGPQGRRIGFQVTFFRIGLAPGTSDRPSAWATHQAWMAHFAVTDAKNERFHAFERFARGGDIALAGARRDPVRVWLEDWTLERRTDGTWHLQAEAGEVAIDLALDPRKAPVLQGDDGLSRKSDQPGNASWYYSFTRMQTEGRVTLGKDQLPVTGSAWMDREWSTSALGPDQQGWDWFALQLDDGTEVMLYVLRRKDGSIDRHSAGVIVRPDGSTRHLDADDYRLEVLAQWKSPRGGTYPARWRINIDGLGRALELVPILADQEITATVRYWEGAVDVIGMDGETIGRGYAELTGYADASE